MAEDQMDEAQQRAWELATATRIAMNERNLTTLCRTVLAAVERREYLQPHGDALLAMKRSLYFMNIAATLAIATQVAIESANGFPLKPEGEVPLPGVTVPPCPTFTA
jgi:hypothetical protein